MIAHDKDVPTIKSGHQLDFQYGKRRILYELQYSARKTLAIDVHPDLSVVVTAPRDASSKAILEKLNKRASWIVQQQRFFQTYLPTLPPRRYVSGESHRYLGRQYRLRVHKGQDDCVKLARGQLNVYLADLSKKARIKALVVAWYRQRAQVIFCELFSLMVAKAERYGIHAESFELRRMQNRWGSCSFEGRIMLNPDLVMVPKFCIEYVITHELCHLKQHNHGPRFYRLLSQIMPDWEKRKKRIDEIAGTCNTGESNQSI